LSSCLSSASAALASLIALDDALKALASIDTRKARVIELRFLVGLSVEETAEVLTVSADTVLRDSRHSERGEIRQTSDLSLK
jgi:RNA polymerase sigma-70 factor, ECF subfamily